MQLTPTIITLCLAIAAPLAGGQVLNEDFKLLPSDGAGEDFFGFAVAVSGTTAVVGAHFDDDNGGNSGSAYLFSTTTGQQLDKLLANDGALADRFGVSVAISGSRVVVGASQDDDNGHESGSAYLFNATTGLQTAKLLPNDGAADDLFGFAVAISGNTVVVGAPQDNDNGTYSGSAYLFNATTGLQTAKLLPNDGAQFNNFGSYVAISGTTALIGAYLDDDNGPGSGSAYLFNTTTGLQTAKLLPNDGAAADRFGNSVAISGTTAVVGAPLDDDSGGNSGSAYLFSTTTGLQTAKLLPNDGAPFDWFGYSVAISGTLALVSAPFDDDNGTQSGSAYLFDTTTGQQIAKLLPSDGAAGDEFGWAVALSGATGVVAAWRDGDNGGNSGSAYAFDVSQCPGDIADSSGILGPDGMVDFGDVLALLGLVGPCPGNIPGCTGDIADSFATLVPDGQVDFGDFLAMLGLVGPCP